MTRVTQTSKKPIFGACLSAKSATAVAQPQWHNQRVSGIQELWELQGGSPPRLVRRPRQDTSDV